MIHTESIGYATSTGKLVPLTNEKGEVIRQFVSAESLEDVRGLLESLVTEHIREPVLFITRHTGTF